MLQATKVRIYPTAEQANFLNRQFGAVHFAYNKALHIISSQCQLHSISPVGDHPKHTLHRPAEQLKQRLIVVENQSGF